jgi:hypothetical protein
MIEIKTQATTATSSGIHTQDDRPTRIAGARSNTPKAA